MDHPCRLCGQEGARGLYEGGKLCVGCIERADDRDHADHITELLLKERQRRMRARPGAAVRTPVPKSKHEIAQEARRQHTQDAANESSARSFIGKEAAYAGVSVEDYMTRYGLETDRLVRAYLAFRALPIEEQRLGFDHWLRSDASTTSHRSPPMTATATEGLEGADAELGHIQGLGA
jgi:hypothetical protein